VVEGGAWEAGGLALVCADDGLADTVCLAVCGVIADRAAVGECTGFALSA
jgi:hypothetical protein